MENEKCSKPPTSWDLTDVASPIGSMELIYMVTWIPSIYPIYVSIYTSTMDPMGLIT
jgi:hypothetical protein